MKTGPGHFIVLTALLCFAFSMTFAKTGTEDIFKTKTVRGSTYELLNHISTITGYLFVYDSKAVDNQKRSRIESGEYTIEEAVKIITVDENLLIKKEGGYIAVLITSKASAYSVWN